MTITTLETPRVATYRTRVCEIAQNDPHREARGWLCQARTDLKQHRTGEAKALLKRAFKYFRDSGIQWAQVLCLCAWAEALISERAYRDALAALFRAEELALADEELRTEIDLVAPDAFLALGEYEEARIRAQRAIEFLEAHPDPEMLCAALRLQGDIAYEVDDDGAHAHQYYLHALDLARAAGDTHTIHLLTRRIHAL